MVEGPKVSDKRLPNLDGDRNMECPTCGFDYVHPVAVQILAGTQHTFVNSKGTHMEAGNPCGRGVRIVTTFLCENGCVSSIAFQFEKGKTEVTTYELQVIEDFEERPDTIWRD